MNGSWGTGLAGVVACIAAVWSAALVGAVEPSLVAAGLDSPVAMAARPPDSTADAGPSELFIASGPRARWQVWRRDSLAPIEAPSNGADATARALACLGPKTIVVAGDSPGLLEVFSYSDSGARLTLVQPQDVPLPFARAGESSAIALAVDAQRLLVTRDGELAEARHSAEILQRCLSVAIDFRCEPIIALSADQQLATILKGPEGIELAMLRLDVNDPPFVATWPLEVDEVRALAYGSTPRPQARRLYALADDGAYEIVANFDATGRPGARMMRVAESTDPTAFAVAGDAIYIAEREPTGAAYRIVRHAGAW